MESFFTNPGFIHIGEKIFLFLDHEALMSCRCVCQPWNNFLKNNASFWLKKCMKKDIPEQYHKKWNQLIQNAKNEENIDLEHKITLLLMKMYQCAPKGFQAPLHMASKLGDLVLLKNIIELFESTFMIDGLFKYSHYANPHIIKHGGGIVTRLLNNV